MHYITLYKSIRSYLLQVFPDAIRFWRDNQKRGNFVLTTSRDETDEPITNTLHRRWGMLPEPQKFRNLRLAMPICEGVIHVGSEEYDLCRPLLRADYKEFYYFNTSRPLKALMVTDSGSFIHQSKILLSAKQLII